MLVVSVASFDVSDLLCDSYAGTMAQLRQGGAIHRHCFCFVRAAEGSYGRSATHLLMITAQKDRQELVWAAIAP